MIKIAIITSLYNGSSTLEKLIDSINVQSNIIDEWIVVDNFSIDNPESLIKSRSKVKLKYFKKKSSIYEAINFALKNCVSTHYIVLGADDELLFPSLSKFTKNYFNFIDNTFIFDVLINNKVSKGFYPRLSILGASKVVNSHSAGMLIPKKIHNIIGYYRTDLKICSDSDIIIKILKSDFKIEYIPITLGKFSTNGVSNRNTYLSLKENYKIMLDNNYNLFIQTILFYIRVIKNLYKIIF